MEQRALTVTLLFFAIVAIFAASGMSRGVERIEEEKEGATVVNSIVDNTVRKEPPLFVFPTLDAVRVAELEAQGHTSENEMSSKKSEATPSSFMRRAWNAPPKLSAEIVLVADAETGTNYFERNSNSRWPLASITKLVAAAVASDAVPVESAIMLKEEDFRSGGNSFTKELKAGDVYLAKDLVRVMLLVSSNESAEAFARIVGYTEFVARMNKKAEEWGLAATYFKDPTGVAAANQSTAREIIYLAERMRMEYPALFDVTKKTSISIPELGSGTMRTFLNINIFAGDKNFLGGKTGQTPEAGENLLSLFSYGGKTLIVVVLGAENRFEATSQLFQWFIHDFIPSN